MGDENLKESVVNSGMDGSRVKERRERRRGVGYSRWMVGLCVWCGECRTAYQMSIAPGCTPESRH